MHRPGLIFDRPMTFGSTSKIRPHTTQLFGRLVSLGLVGSDLDVSEVMHLGFVLIEPALSLEGSLAAWAAKRTLSSLNDGRYLLRFFFSCQSWPA